MAFRGLGSYAVTAAAARAGTESAGPGLLLAVVALGGSITTAALMVAALTASAAVAGPLVGTFLDHTTRPARTLGAALTVFAATLAVIAVLLLALPAVWAIPLAVVAGLGQPAATGAWTAQLPWVVTPGRLPRAYAVDAGTYNVGALVGPALAASALLIAPVAPVLVTVALLLVGLAMLPLVPLGTRPPSGSGRPRWADVVAGMRGLLGTRALRFSTTVTTVGFAGQAALIVAAPVLSVDLTGGLAFTGWLLAAVAVGGLAGSAALTGRPLARPDLALTIAQLLVGTGLLVIGVGSSVPVVVVGALVLGAGDAVLITSMFQVRARDSSPQLRARVFTSGASLRTAAYATAIAVFGVLVGWGAAAVLAIGAAVQLVALAAGRIAAGASTRPPAAEVSGSAGGATPRR